MFEQKAKVIEGPGTVVGANVKLAGTLKDVNDITIHGQVEGEIISEKNVMVAKNATIKGPIKAKDVLISGKVNGEITAYDRIEITESGEVSGSITTNNLIIKSGAVFNGKSIMKQTLQNKDKQNQDKNISQKKNENEDKKNESKKETHDIFKSIKNSKYELE